MMLGVEVGLSLVVVLRVVVLSIVDIVEGDNIAVLLLDEGGGL